MDPFNESPWRYLIGLLKEQHRLNPDVELLEEYETKANSLRSVLSDAHREPDTCSNLTSARIDIFEMIGTEECLTKVRRRHTCDNEFMYMFERRLTIILHSLSLDLA